MDSLLVPINREGNGTPFFLLPATGTTPFSMIHLGQNLKGIRPLYTFEFAGLTNKRNRHGSFEEMAACYVEEIRSEISGGPYVIGGYCLGGGVAIEIVAMLEQLGETVQALLLFESIPPMIKGNVVDPGEISSMPEVRAVQIAVEQMMLQLSKLPPKLREKFGLFGREQIEMSFRYLASPVEAPISLFHTKSFEVDTFSAWQNLTRGKFQMETISGEIFSILAPPHIEITAERIEKSLL